MYDIDLVQLKKFIKASSYDYDDIMIKNGNDPDTLRKKFSSIRYYNNVTIVNIKDTDNYNDKLKKIINDKLEIPAENFLIFEYDTTGDYYSENKYNYYESFYDYVLIYLDNVENKLKLLKFSILEEEEIKNKVTKTIYTYYCNENYYNHITLEYIIRHYDNTIEIIATHFGYNILLNSL